MQRVFPGLILLFAWLNADVRGQDTFVPFVIPGEPNPASLLAPPFSPIEPNTPRIEVSGHQFVQDGARIRLWGVNTSFSANFPGPVRAERMAKHLAAMGVNSIRLHHMDTLPWPDGLWDPGNPGSIHPVAQDRLDYFVHQLAEHGIWINLNLHVGHAHSADLGLPDPGTDYDKIVGVFTPPLVGPEEFR